MNDGLDNELSGDGGSVSGSDDDNDGDNSDARAQREARAAAEGRTANEHKQVTRLPACSRRGLRECALSLRCCLCAQTPARVYA